MWFGISERIKENKEKLFYKKRHDSFVAEERVIVKETGMLLINSPSKQKRN